MCAVCDDWQIRPVLGWYVGFLGFCFVLVLTYYSVECQTKSLSNLCVRFIMVPIFLAINKTCLSYDWFGKQPKPTRMLDIMSYFFAVRSLLRLLMRLHTTPQRAAKRRTKTLMLKLRPQSQIRHSRRNSWFIRFPNHRITPKDTICKFHKVLLRFAMQICKTSYR